MVLNLVQFMRSVLPTARFVPMMHLHKTLLRVAVLRLTFTYGVSYFMKLVEEYGSAEIAKTSVSVHYPEYISRCPLKGAHFDNTEGGATYAEHRHRYRFGFAHTGRQVLILQVALSDRLLDQSEHPPYRGQSL